MSQESLIRISVRNLVEFILREGDIDNRKTGVSEKYAMQLGSRIHRKIQRQMGSNYRAEIPLKLQIPCDGFMLQLEGRADGIFEKDGQIVIALTNVSLDKEQAIDIALEGTNAKSVNGQILTAKNVADFNDFDHPDRVKVADFKQAKLKKNVLSVKIPAKSLVVMTLK